MENAEIVRLEKSPAGTFGVLRVDDEVLCVTLEPPDRNNAPDISCIPAGEYVCRRVQSPTFGPTYEIANVPGRSHILFHQGNLVVDTHGCVLLGRNFGVLDGDRAIMQSRPALREFLDRCRGVESFSFKISEQC